MKDGPGDEDYYYYDGGRWNKHKDIWRGTPYEQQDEGNNTEADAR